jgi:chorismate mutase
MSRPTLARLRKEIARTDARILHDVAHRLDLAREIGGWKRTAGLPVRDYLTERVVVTRWVRGLAALEVPADRAEILVRWLIEESVFAQEGTAEGTPNFRRPSDVVALAKWVGG